MQHPKGATDSAVLKLRWRQWTGVVEYVAGGRRGSVDPEAYARLHTDLVRICRRLAGQGPPEKRSSYERVQNLVGPWMSFAVLARTDPELLVALLRRCQAVDRELYGRTWLTLAGRAASQVALALVLAAVLIPLGRLTSQQAIPVVEKVQDWALELRLAIKYSSPTERLLVGGIAATLIAVSIISRSTRT